MSSSTNEPQRRVLIASANPLFARALQKLVAQRWEGRNIEIRMAGSMDEATSALESWQPDLVIVDYDDMDKPGNIHRAAFLSHFITGERPMQVMLVSLRESGEVVVYDRRTLTPAQAEDWLDFPWTPVQAQAAPQVLKTSKTENPEKNMDIESSERQFRQRSGGMKHYLIVAVLTIVLTLLVGFGMIAANLTPNPASAQAVPVDAMIHLQTWLIAFIFSLIVSAIGYSIFAFRNRGEGEYGAPFKSSLGLEVTWTLIPLALVLWLAFIGAQDLAIMGKVDPAALEVKVTAFQWGWMFEYPEWGIQSNSLYLPVNRQVHFSLTSRDVIHSFYVPEFRIKQDVLPGKNLVKELRITPTEIGDFKVRCAEMCGGAHALMLAPVKVVSQADFQTWVDAQSNTASLSPEERGQRLAKTQGCLTCHSTDGSRIIGPTWQGLYGHEVKLADGSTVTADEAYLHRSIVDPSAQVVESYPAGVMPSYQNTLSDEQINDIIAFIKTLK